MSTPTRRSQRIASIQKVPIEKPKKKKTARALKSGQEANLDPVETESDENLDVAKRLVFEKAKKGPSVDSLNTAVFDDIIEEEVEKSAFVRRKNTSTDDLVLDRSVDDEIDIPWPPRYPSEDNEAAQSFTCQLLTSELEEFGEKSDSIFWDSLSEKASPTFIDREEMEDPTASNPANKGKEISPAIVNSVASDPDILLKQRSIKLAAKKVRNVLRGFTAEIISELDIDDYKIRLKEIRDELGVFQGLVDEFVLDLEENTSQNFESLIKTIEDEKSKLEKEVSDNQNGVQEKIKEFLNSKPLSKAEEEQINLQKKKLAAEEAKDLQMKEERLKKAEVDRKSLSKRVATLKSVLC